MGTLLVVAVVLGGGGLAIVKLTEQRDRRDGDAELRRVIGNLSPPVAGVLGLMPVPPAGAGRGSNAKIQLIGPRGNQLVHPGNGAPPRAAGDPGVVRALIDAFNQSGESAGSVGQVNFLRAVAIGTHRVLIVGLVPREFGPPRLAAGARTVQVAGQPWRDVTVSEPLGMVVEVAAHEQISARATSLRSIVLLAGILGLLVALVGTRLLAKLALAPLVALRRAAEGVRDAPDLVVRVSTPGQPQEVAELARELDQMLARLDRAVTARDSALRAARRFAADAGHELRTPLQSVRGNLDIARRVVERPHELEVALDAATQACERLHRLVDGLQALARGEAGPSSATEQVDLGDLADGAAFATRSRHPELTLELDVPSRGPIVSGDSDGLWRVIENLLENAARHGRQGGRVRLRVAETGSGAEIVVDDDGPGVPEAERTRVQLRFERGTAAGGGGNGLGLAIVAAEARRHGGDLALSASPFGGLRVRVKICSEARDLVPGP